MNAPPVVLLVGPWPPTVGGVTSFMLKLEASPASRAVRFRRFTTSRPPKRGTIDNWGYGAALRGGPARLLRGACVTAWHMAAFPPAAARADIVQVQASDYLTFWEAAYYLAAARALRRRTILRLGGGFDAFYAGSSPSARRAIRRVLAWPDQLIVQSPYWRTLVAQLGRTDGVTVLPNWVPDDLATPVVRPDRPPTTLFIAGTEARRKGIDTVLAAAARTQGLRWRIVAAPSLPTQPGIEPEGPLPHHALLDAMRQADIFVLPSHAEGFPNSLIEAMALGLPCIATPVGAVPDILGDAGLLIPPGDAAALARHAAALAADPARRRQMGEAARQAVLARYTESRVIETVLALYVPANSAS